MAVAGEEKTRIQAANERKILDAALATFSEHGFRGSTIDMIAGRAGMSKPNLLYYFSGKKAIYLAVLEATLTGWLEPLEQLDPSGDPVGEIEGYIQRKLEMSRESPAASRLFALEVINGAPHIYDILTGELASLVEEKCAVIQSWIDEGRLNAVNPHHLIFMIWATTQHYADFQVQVEAVLGPKASREEIFDEAGKTLYSVFLAGLKP